MDRGDLLIAVGNLDWNICPLPRVPARQCSGERLPLGFLTAAIGWSAVDLHSAERGFVSYQHALSWLIAFACMACAPVSACM